METLLWCKNISAHLPGIMQGSDIGGRRVLCHTGQQASGRHGAGGWTRRKLPLAWPPRTPCHGQLDLSYLNTEEEAHIYVMRKNHKDLSNTDLRRQSIVQLSQLQRRAIALRNTRSRISSVVVHAAPPQNMSRPEREVQQHVSILRGARSQVLGKHGQRRH